MMNIVRQRARLTRLAVERFDRLSDRNVAWSDQENVAIVFQPRNENFLVEVQDNYKVIGSVYRCLHEAFNALTRTYAIFFCVFVYSEVTVHSMQLFVNTSDVNRLSGIFVTAGNCVIDIMLLVICESITYEFQRLQCMINSFYYKEKLSTLRVATKRLLYQYAHRERKVDCGFFDLDIALLPVLYTFISLFVFAMFGSPFNIEQL